MIRSKAHGELLTCLMDTPDFDRFIASINRTIFVKRDHRGIYPVYLEKRHEHSLSKWVMAPENDGDLRVHVRNGNMLDCRRSNLELVTRAVSTLRTQQTKKESGLPHGVTLDRRRLDRPYMVRIKIGRRHVYVGNYDDIDEAVRAHEAALKQALEEQTQ